MNTPTDPRLRPLQHQCSSCGCRCHANDDFACSCLRDYRWNMRLLGLFAVVMLTAIGVVPIVLLIWGGTR